MSNNRLIYMPLGGAGEIGMNAYVFGYGEPGKERLILVDIGVTFPDMDGSPGVDLILPDIAWLEERREQLEAIFITHAHEDHIGAIGLLWDRLRAPVYARPFTAHLARHKTGRPGAGRHKCEDGATLARDGTGGAAFQSRLCAHFALYSRKCRTGN